MVDAREIVPEDCSARTSQTECIECVPRSGEGETGVDEELNSSKRELAYEDYYCTESSELNQKKQRTECSVEPSAVHQSSESSASDDERRGSLPVEALNQKVQTSLRLDDLRAENWRRHAHIPNMLEKASVEARSFLDGSLVDDLADLGRPKNAQRRYSFVVHRNHAAVKPQPENSFHESLPLSATSAWDCFASSNSDEQGVLPQKSAKELHRSLCQPFEVPCWRKPVTCSSFQSQETVTPKEV